MKHGLLIAHVLATLAAFAGCTSESSLQMAVRDLPVDADTALAAANTVLRDDFDRLNVDRVARRIVSEPQEYSTQSESQTSRDLVRARSAMRRIATCNVVSRGPDSSQIRLRIERQREDTARTEQTEPGQYRLSDSPAYTPVERDAATTPRQNTVWTSIGRDAAMERSILGELERQFSKFAPEPSSGSLNEPELDRKTAIRAKAGQQPAARPANAQGPASQEAR